MSASRSTLPGSALPGVQENLSDELRVTGSNGMWICRQIAGTSYDCQQAGNRAGADRNGSIVTPGLFDVQVNGFAGVDFNDADIEPTDMDRALSRLAASGVTRVLPTLITACDDELAARLEALDRAVSQSVLGPLMVPGYHLEGPFLSPLDGCAGCHPTTAMGPARPELIERLAGLARRPILMVTMAPEQEGVPQLMARLAGQGIACAIGHSNASREQIGDAIRMGARVSTHLGNGLPHMIARTDNPLFSQLSRDELMAGFIADGIHIHPDYLKLFLRAKGLERAFLVTDAVAAAGPGMGEGLYRLGAMSIERQADGTVRIPGSTYLAGSSATMDQMVRNMEKWQGMDLPDILKLTLDNPFRATFNRPFDLQRDHGGGFVHWQRDDAGELRVRRTRIGEHQVLPDGSFLPHTPARSSSAAR
ncbi:MAG TPA: N-acetylglucosamine-6-phosphate deacetylase [Devosia sp.]|nr:N-acetylglucosamine-6-phosphate deacetylase [Devosia sp.]